MQHDLRRIAHILESLCSHSTTGVTLEYVLFVELVSRPYHDCCDSTSDLLPVFLQLITSSLNPKI